MSKKNLWLFFAAIAGIIIGIAIILAVFLTQPKNNTKTTSHDNITIEAEDDNSNDMFLTWHGSSNYKYAAGLIIHTINPSYKTVFRNATKGAFQYKDYGGSLGLAVTYIFDASANKYLNFWEPSPNVYGIIKVNGVEFPHGISSLQLKNNIKIDFVIPAPKQ